MAEMDWDDLRYILAVAEHGSLAAAARALRVNHTTVLRRVHGFEAARGVRLFDRLPGGYALTPGGEAMLAAARAMRQVVDDLERQVTGQDARLDGTLRVTTADTLMEGVVPALLATFRGAHPGIGLEVTVGNAMADLSRRDADVAIRPTSRPPEALVGRRVCAIAYLLYRAADVADDAGWIAPDDSLASSAIGRWARRHLDPARVILRTDSLVAMRNAAQAGLGVAALPAYLGDIAHGLVRCLPDHATPAPTDLWLLTHADLRHTARIRAFMDHAGAALEARRAVFEAR